MELAKMAIPWISPFRVSTQGGDTQAYSCRQWVGMPPVCTRTYTQARAGKARRGSPLSPPLVHTQHTHKLSRRRHVLKRANFWESQEIQKFPGTLGRPEQESGVRGGAGAHCVALPLVPARPPLAVGASACGPGASVDGTAPHRSRSSFVVE